MTEYSIKMVSNNHCTYIRRMTGNAACISGHAKFTDVHNLRRLLHAFPRGFRKLVVIKMKQIGK